MTTHTNRLTVWQATISGATARLRRPKVTAIVCQHCRKWVKPRRWNPRLYACKKCVHTLAHNVYAARAHRDLQREALNALVVAHAHDKHLRQWRRHAAQVTSTA